MALAPFAPGGVHTRRTAEMFVQMRKQGVDLERQLTTGKRADSFGGLGFARRTSLDLRAKLSALEGFQTSIKDSDLRLKLMLKSTEGLDKIASATRSSARLPSSGITGSNPLEQMQAQGNLKLAIDMLNSQINGRYMFSGAATDQKPVANYAEIVSGVQAAIAARTGIDDIAGSGTVSAVPAGNNVDVSKAGPATNGFTLLDSSSTHTSIVTAAPTQFSVNSEPPVGTRISLQLGLPDGSTETIALTAVDTTGAPGPGRFNVDADNAITAANIATALNAALTERAGTALASASAMKAAEDHFALGSWYNGDPGDVAQARSTAPVRIDATQTVGTGAQANEEGFRTLLTQLAVLSAVDFSDGNQKRYDALLQRVAGNLSPTASGQKISDIGIDLGNAHAVMAGAKERHQATAGILMDSLGNIEEAPTEEVAAKLLTMQTRLQASYQTTSLLSRLSLVNYL
jgi:flagellar hook-associated protein 3 FlgL